MIYWFTGQPGAGKTIQATKLKEFLQTEKRNWRKDVFHIDGDDSLIWILHPKLQFNLLQN